MSSWLSWLHFTRRCLGDSSCWIAHPFLSSSSQIGSPDARCSTRGEVNTPLSLEGKLVLKKRKERKKTRKKEEGGPVVEYIFSLLEARGMNIRCDIPFPFLKEEKRKKNLILLLVEPLCVTDRSG